MPSLINNYMGSATQDNGPTTEPDWQVLLSAYAPLVLYGAACAAGRIYHRRAGNRRTAVTK